MDEDRIIYVTHNVRLHLKQRLALEAYAKDHGISLAVATRQAIDLLINGPAPTPRKKRSAAMRQEDGR